LHDLRISLSASCILYTARVTAWAPIIRSQLPVPGGHPAARIEIPIPYPFVRPLGSQV
jgi:hypothetical protein